MSVIWITGASSGIGEAVALRYAAEGATVAASARSVEALVALETRASKAGRIISFPLDVTDRAACARVVGEIEQALGPIDLAILNAGTHQGTAGNDFDAGVFDRLFAINFFGAVNSLAAIVPAMVARKRGRIAIVASVAGYSGLPSAAAYGASKAALINMTEALATDLRPSGITVNLVSPGFVRTPLTDRNDFPMPALMEVDAAAERMVRGLEGTAFEITFPRRFTYVIKLLRMLPYRLYFPIIRKFTGL